jgi:hypothetical protein
MYPLPKQKVRSPVSSRADSWGVRAVEISIQYKILHVSKGNGKAIPLQALTGPEGSRRLRLPDFKTIGT